MCAQQFAAFAGGSYVFFLLRLVVNAFFFCRADLQIYAKSFKNVSQRGAGVPQETPRDAQKASLRASGSALGALWTHLERHWGIQEVILRAILSSK